MGGRRPEKEIHKEKHAPQAPCALEPCGHPGFPGGSVGNESTCKVGNWGSILGLGRSPGEGNGNPFQYSCLENPVNRGAWRATVHGVTKSQTRLRDFTFTFGELIHPVPLHLPSFPPTHPVLSTCVCQALPQRLGMQQRTRVLLLWS